jgi:hypothetical protein
MSDLTRIEVKAIAEIEATPKSLLTLHRATDAGGNTALGHT